VYIYLEELILLPTSSLYAIINFGFKCLHQSLNIQASNSVMNIALPAIMMKFVCPGGFQS
jgi:hypothetical protein